MTLRWLIAGCQGQLGHALVERLAADPGCEVVAAIDREGATRALASMASEVVTQDRPEVRSNEEVPVGPALAWIS